MSNTRSKTGAKGASGGAGGKGKRAAVDEVEFDGYDGDVLEEILTDSEDEAVGSAARQGDKRQRKHVRDRNVLNWYHKFAGYDGKKLPRDADRQ